MFELAYVFSKSNYTKAIERSRNECFAHRSYESDFYNHFLKDYMNYPYLTRHHYNAVKG